MAEPLSTEEADVSEDLRTDYDEEEAKVEEEGVARGGQVDDDNVKARRVVQADNQALSGGNSDENDPKRVARAVQAENQAMSSNSDEDDPKRVGVITGPALTGAPPPPPREPRLASRTTAHRPRRPGQQPAASEPGAVAVAGTALTRRERARRTNEAEARQSQARRTSDGLPERNPTRRLSAAELLEAQLVSQGTLAVAVEDNSHKLRRYIIVGTIVALLAIAGLTAGLVVEANHGDGGGEEQDLCSKPVQTLSVLDLCTCFNTTEALNLSENEEEFYNDELTPLLLKKFNYSSGVIDRDSCTPQNQAALSLANYERLNLTTVELDYISEREDILLERFILNLFFIIMGGKQWTLKGGWLRDGRICSWHGILCPWTERVGRISLAKNNLQGELDRIPELWQMPYLTDLTLGQNRGVNGTIPSQVGNSQFLGILDLAECSLSGTIPTEIGKLERLRLLALARNNLAGPIPGELGNLKRLSALAVSFNKISGTLPKEMSSDLEQVDLQETEISGELPTYLSAPNKNLQTVFLRDTMLNGTIQGNAICEENPTIWYVVNCETSLINCNGTGTCCNRTIECVEDVPPKLLEKPERIDENPCAIRDEL